MDSSPEGPLDDDPATQYVANVTAAEELQNLGIDTSNWDLFQDIPPVDPDVPRIGDPIPQQIAPPARQPITTGVGTSTRQRASTPPLNLVQQAMTEADIDTSTPINTGPGTRPNNTTRSRARRRRPTATTTSRSRARRRPATVTSASRSGAARRRQRPTTTTTTTTAPARGRMQQQLRLLLDDIAADSRDISNIVTTNTVTTTYKQNRRRPTVTNTRTRVGNNPRNRPSVSRTSTRVTP